jgi:hypothetical protein
LRNQKQRFNKRRNPIMSCLYGDQPLRIQLSKNGVIHAGSYQNYGGFLRSRFDPINGVLSGSEWVPEKKQINIACRHMKYGESLEHKKISNKKKITCKSCMKLMGLLDEPLSTDRFVVRRKDTGEFFKNTNTRCTSWSDSVYDAFFFKRRHTAEGRCKVMKYETKDGTLLSYKEWVAKDRPSARPRGVYDQNLEVKKIKVSIE